MLRVKVKQFHDATTYIRDDFFCEISLNKCLDTVVLIHSNEITHVPYSISIAQKHMSLSITVTSTLHLNEFFEWFKTIVSTNVSRLEFNTRSFIIITIILSTESEQHGQCCTSGLEVQPDGRDIQCHTCTNDISIRVSGKRPKWYAMGYCSERCMVIDEKNISTHSATIVGDKNVIARCKRCNMNVVRIEGKGCRPKWYKKGYCSTRCLEEAINYAISRAIIDRN